MKTLHVAASLASAWGGPTRVIVHLTQHLQARGVACSVAAPDFGGGPPVDTGAVPSRIFPVGRLAPWWKGYSPALARELPSLVDDVSLVHIHELWHHAHFAAYRAARACGKPYLVSPHGALEQRSLIEKTVRKRIYMALVERRILEGAAMIHAVTTAEIDQIRAQGIAAPAIVIPNGVYEAEFHPRATPTAFHERFPQARGHDIILFLGRLHRVKGLDLLAAAFIALARERPGLKLVIAGPDEGGCEAETRRRLREAGVLDRAIFTGLLTGPIKLSAFAAADVFVLPSYSEGFSLAVLEAMASGLPVVISHRCFFPEVATAGAGMIVDTQTGALTSALGRLLDDGEMRRRMGESARRLVLERYTWRHAAARMEQAYRMATGHAGRERVGVASTNSTVAAITSAERAGV